MRRLNALAVVGATAIAACGHSGVELGFPPGYEPGAIDGGTHDGLPCDVANLLQTRCDTCHSSTPIGGAPMPLVTLADLQKPSLSDSTQTNTQLSLARMQSSSSP